MKPVTIALGLGAAFIAYKLFYKPAPKTPVTPAPPAIPPGTGKVLSPPAVSPSGVPIPGTSAAAPPGTPGSPSNPYASLLAPFVTMAQKAVSGLGSSAGNPSGIVTGTSTNSDGSTTTVNADGSTTTHYPDGSIVTNNPDGSTSIDDTAARASDSGVTDLGTIPSAPADGSSGSADGSASVGFLPRMQRYFVRTPRGIVTMVRLPNGRWAVAA